MRLMLLVPLLLLAGCATRKEFDGPKVAAFRYCVVPKDEAHGQRATALAILGKVVEVVKDNDERLTQPDVRKATCVASVDYWHGFWSCKSEVKLRPLTADEDAPPVLRVRGHYGMFWAGSHHAVADALQLTAESIALAHAYPTADTK